MNDSEFSFIGLIIRIAITAILIYILLRRRKKELKEIEAKYQKEMEEVTDTVATVITSAEDTFNRIEYGLSNLLGESEPFSLYGKSHFIRCLISSDIENELYSFVRRMDTEDRRIYEILQLFQFISIPSPKDRINPGRIVAGFYQSVSAATVDQGWSVMFWVIEVGINARIEHNLNGFMLVPRHPTSIIGDLPEMPSPRRDLGSKWYKVPWLQIFSSDYHVFTTMAELQDFLEELKKNEKHLKLMFHNARAVTSENLVPPVEHNFYFDPEWLEQRELQQETT